MTAPNLVKVFTEERRQDLQFAAPLKKKAP